MSAMNDIEEFIQLIHSSGDLAHFVGGCSDELIADIETLLGTPLPPSYVTFLRNLGECDIAGDEFFGAWRRDGNLYGSARVTQDLRARAAMPPTLIAFMSDGMGGYYVMDSTRLDVNGEAAVGAWMPGPQEDVDLVEYVASSFGTFALERARLALSS